ncbi:MAG: heavy metal translocating P-type ATPase [Syntrophobacteraceae bacterium]
MFFVLKRTDSTTKSTKDTKRKFPLDSATPHHYKQLKAIIMDPDITCHLCGLAVGGSNLSQPVAGRTVYFCCPGCMFVFQVLFNSPEGFPEDYKNTELYKACVSAGLIPSEAGAGERFEAADVGSRSAQPNPHSGGREAAPPPRAAGESGPGMAEIREGLSREVSLRIEGMWCVACSWLIEHLLRRMDGVLSAGIFFFSDIARVKYMPHLIEPRQIMDSISRLGYRAVPVESAPDSAESADLVVRLGVSAILAMNIMMISMALYWGFFEEIGAEGAAYFSYALWALATPVVFYGGWPILRRAFWGIRHLTPTMDLLIAAGTLSAYVYSVAQMLRASPHVYFDTASTLVTLVLLGRFIELRARQKISAGITALFHAANTKARLVRDGREVWVSAERVRPGDAFRVLRGERVPVDGRVCSERAVVDESVITGESRPVEKPRGASVPAGALLLGADAEFEAERPGAESSLNQIVALIQEALSTKNRVELFADRAMRVLVPGVLALAGAVAAVLFLSSVPADEALLRALTVLVITCPCALGIATPLARVAAIARARASGILIRNPALFERTEGLREVIFDKTGTLTEGKYVLREIAVTDGPEDVALRRVASAEAKADHFLARETVRAARERGIELAETLSFEPIEGLGVVALTGCGEVIAGNRRLMVRYGLEMPGGLDARARLIEAGGATVVFFAWSGAVKGFLAFGDRVRENAAVAVSQLRERGISVSMVSGDSEETTRAVARELGIERCVGQALPKDKVDIIAEIQARGLRVAMAGDGVNDAAALARADIGITVGPGANLIRECADAAVLGDDPLKIPELLALSKLTFKVIRQNLFFAFIYNLLGIPLAAAGLLNPLLAAFAMFASSATVLGNTLRISRFGKA